MLQPTKTMLWPVFRDVEHAQRAYREMALIYEAELRRSDRRVLWLLFVIAAMIVAMTVFSFVFHVPCR